MNIGFVVALERGVWDALVRGDTAADRAALSDDFVGVYPTGFCGASEHAAQLAGGPTVVSYELDETRILPIGPDYVMLSYRADYRRPGSDVSESMYVSSLWANRGGRWQNVFSQDTPVGDAVV